MADKDRRFSPLTALGDGVLLLCALCGLAGCFLSIYTGQEAAAWGDVSLLARCAGEMGLFYLCAGLFGLLALLVWSLPKYRGGLAGGLTALWLLWAWRRWDNLLSGALFTCKTVADLFAARVNWGKTFPYDTGLSYLRAVGNTRLFLLAVLALLALVLGWAVVRARRWWLVLALTLPPLLPGLVADLYPHWPAFLALCTCWCAMILCDLCRWAAPSARGKLTLTALPCVGLVLLFITLAFPREGYTRPQWALDAETGLHNTANRASDFFSQWDGPFKRPGSVTYVGSAGEADLAQAGPLRYSGRTVLRVTADYTGLLYLRGSSLAVYEDGVWKPLPEGTWQEYSDHLADGENTLSPLVFPAGLNGRAATSTISVQNIGAVGGCVYSPYFLADQDWAALGMLPVEDAYFAYVRGQQTHTMGFCPPDVPLYSSSSAEVDAYQEYARMNYLDVPQELAELLRELCRQNGIYETDYYPGQSQPETASLVARQVTDMLDSLFEYDPETPAAPEGVDPVLYFLTVSRRGYCMHYASAATLMLRTMGVPARYVSGFFADCVDSKRVDIPDRAAHAWVEVWVDGFGWCPVDVTPDAYEWYEAQQNAAASQPTEEPSRPPEETETPEPTPTPTLEPEQENTPAPSGAPQGGSGGGFQVPVKLLKTLLRMAGAAALLWLGWYLPKKHRKTRANDPDPSRAGLACYGYLLRLKRWGGRIDGRAVELAEKAKYSRQGLSDEDANELRLLLDWEHRRLCIVLHPVKALLLRCLWGTPPNLKKQKIAENSGENGG